MAARKQLEETPPEAIEVARMRVYSRLEPGRLTSRTGAGDFRVAAVWSTYQGPGVEALAGWEKVETLRDGPLAVTIYRRSSYL